MSERNYLEETLYDYFKSILDDIGAPNTQIIFEGENGVRPKPPFISIGFNGVTALGSTPHMKPRMQKTGDDRYIETSVQPVERSCTLRGFGQTTEDLLNEMRELVHFDKWINSLYKNKCVIKNVQNVVESVNDYSEDEETFYALDFTLCYTRMTQVENEYIGSVEITTEGLDRLDGDKTAGVDINIQEEETNG